MNMIQPGTGLIIAMAQSRPVMGSNAKKGQTYWNLAVDPAMGGIQGYQAGSTFKVFTIAAALEKGIPISKKFNARSPMNFSGRSIQSCHGRRRVSTGAGVSATPSGHSRTIGHDRGAPSSPSTPTSSSSSWPPACAGSRRWPRRPASRSARAAAGDIVDYYQDKPSFTLGSVEVSPLSMAEAYATFAARGIHCDPMIVSKITTRANKNLGRRDANCRRVIDKEVADGVNKMLRRSMDKGTGKRAKIYDGRDIAGKTGTINSNEAVWFAGYTPEIAGVAMISIDNTKKPFIKSARPSVQAFRAAA